MDPFKLVITYCINLTALIALMRKNTTLFTHRKLLIIDVHVYRVLQTYAQAYSLV